jgi:S1-C subfamily serine protease
LGSSEGIGQGWGNFDILFIPELVPDTFRVYIISDAAQRRNCYLVTKEGAGETASKPRLGVKYSPTDANFARIAAMDAPKGVVLVAVDPDSAAEKAGLLVGDVVLMVGGRLISNTITSLQEAVENVTPGDTLQLKIWRGGKEEAVPVRF